MGDRKAPSPPPGEPGYTGPPQRRPAPPPRPPEKRFDGPRFVSGESIESGCSNDIAWKLGEVARAAGDPNRTDVGDYIDRGLILLRLLREAGFDLVRRR
jgi:hypothetical protein